jgi:hypothetical protein
MTHYVPQSQSHALMREKQKLARRLLAQGLTVTQICQQLRCSAYFVRQARNQPAPEDTDDAEASKAG